MAKTILFDLDGTLTDSKEGITKCVQYALAKYGIDEPDLSKLESFIGPPLKIHMLERYPHLSEDEANQAVAWYRERYRSVGLFENRVYEGIPELLERLQKAGYTLILATSKPEVYTIRILEHFELKRFFTIIVGSELDGRRGEKDEVIQEALRLGGNPEAIMVGDRKYDMWGAKKHGLRAVGVLYGYGSREELEAAGADEIAESVAELERLLTEK